MANQHIFHPDRGWIKGGLPIVNGVVDVQGCKSEFNCATGETIYTPLTPTEITKREADAVVDAAQREAEVYVKEVNLSELHKEAETNPAFAALLQYMGIK